ncbi:hypothetical protein [Paraflavitalea speifideaquila]|uniref:hypothetical protein n=1 Tax=Paraflavitalea speifideaquila TaxID=3076558 RepID=UPI0028E57B24|nr:hypothetical protein [Paraflavitalea speifideiaquila]
MDFSTTGLSYDANGNILTMNQKGWKSGGSTLIDNLAYNYIAGSNKLLNVIDGVSEPSTPGRLPHIQPTSVSRQQKQQYGGLQL